MKEVLNTIQKKDIVSTFIRSNFQQASFNYERIHALAFCVDMIPTIKRVYKTKEEQREARSEERRVGKQCRHRWSLDK